MILLQNDDGDQVDLQITFPGGREHAVVNATRPPSLRLECRGCSQKKGPDLHRRDLLREVSFIRSDLFVDDTLGEKHTGGREHRCSSPWPEYEEFLGFTQMFLKTLPLIDRSEKTLSKQDKTCQS